MDLDNKVGETVENASVEADGKDVTNTYVTESAQYTEKKWQIWHLVLASLRCLLFYLLFQV